MNMAQVNAAATQARKFLAAVDKLKAVTATPNDAWHIAGSKQSGALRRSSMDLTRRLAEMRKA